MKLIKKEIGYINTEPNYNTEEADKLFDKYSGIVEYLENYDLAGTKWITFNIPKRSSGFRTITAPDESLKSLQRDVIHLLRDDFRIEEHECSYAYIKNRSSTDANYAHTNNKSNWFLKIDIKDFFNSIRTQDIRAAINTVYPTCNMRKDYQDRLENVINKISCKENCIPQGGVSSPFISNWVMVSYLYNIKELINTLQNSILQKQNYTITCYADDIYISAVDKFDWNKLVKEIDKLLAPTFKINYDKVKFVRNRGKNFMLGKMVNKDYQITQGWRKVTQWKHIFLDLCNEINGYKDRCSSYERTELYGKLLWDFNTQKDYLEYLIEKYEKKYTNNKSIINYLKKGEIL